LGFRLPETGERKSKAFRENLDLGIKRREYARLYTMDRSTDGTYILNVAPTGMIPTKAQTPHVPVSVEEIVEQSLEAGQMGATMVHLHARDPETGAPTYKAEIYAKILEGIRRYDKDLILCVSTSGRDFCEFDKRSEVLGLDGGIRPDFASLTLSSLNFNQQASVNSPDTIKGLAAMMLEKGIKPELEAFDLGMINYAHYLIRKKLLKPPFYFNLILGNIACAQANLLSMGLMIRELPEGSFWSVGAVGDDQLRMNITGMASGGGVRVGLEDMIWMDEKRTALATNAALIGRIVAIGEAMGKRPLTPSEARAVFDLPERKKENA
jgi:uncharacterized protein (DUF849 family)